MIECIDPDPLPPACSLDTRREETNNQILHWGKKPSSSALIIRSMISAPAHSCLSLADKDISSVCVCTCVCLCLNPYLLLFISSSALVSTWKRKWSETEIFYSEKGFCWAIVLFEWKWGRWRVADYKEKRTGEQRNRCRIDKERWGDVMEFHNGNWWITKCVLGLGCFQHSSVFHPDPTFVSSGALLPCSSAHYW